MALQPFISREGLGVRNSTGDTLYLRGTVDPSVATGVPAPISSQYNRQNGLNSSIYIKVGAANTAWVQIASQEQKELQTISQVAHGLSVGNVVKIDATGGFILAQADTLTNSDVIGIVETVVDVDNFMVVTSGWSEVATAEADGTALYLDQTTAGQLTATVPTAGIVKQVGFAYDSKVFLQINQTNELTAGVSPLPSIVVNGVTGTTTILQLPVTDSEGALWLVNVKSPTGKYTAILHAIHDDFGAGASQVCWNLSSILRLGDPIAALDINVGLSGTQPNQNIDFIVTTTDTVDVSVRQIQLFN